MQKLRRNGIHNRCEFLYCLIFPSHWVKNDGRLLGNPYDIEKLKKNILHEITEGLGHVSRN
jgi:hypothetical protein